MGSQSEGPVRVTGAPELGTVFQSLGTTGGALPSSDGRTAEEDPGPVEGDTDSGPSLVAGRGLSKIQLSFDAFHNRKS